MWDSRAATEAEAERAIAEYLAQAEKEWADQRTRRHLRWMGGGSQN